jgi:hypothetical protein
MRARFVFLTGVLAVAAVGCGKETDGGGKNVLSGAVTVGGQPAPEAAIVVTAPDGQTAGGTTDQSGRYTIPDPPVGKLQFHFIPAGKSKGIPAKYTRPGNDLAFDYAGGKQTYDIDLKQ